MRNLDPELAPVLAGLPGGGRARLEDLKVMRAMRDTMAVLHALGTELPTDERVTVTDRRLPGRRAGTELPARVYTPAKHRGAVLVFFHGGAYTMGDVYTEEQRCLRLAADGGCVVVSVGYALAPEEPYPAAVLDGYHALQWVAAHAAELVAGGDSGGGGSGGGSGVPLAVAGSSAGGGLAAAVALMARRRGGPPLVFQLLLYPMLDDRLDSASMHMEEPTPLLSRQVLAAAWGYYLGGAPADDLAAPGRAVDLSGLPPAYVMVAELDPLRDEGLAYARRLVEAGVSAEVHLYPGTFHGFDLMCPDTSVGRRALEEQAMAVRRCLAPAHGRKD